MSYHPFLLEKVETLGFEASLSVGADINLGCCSILVCWSRLKSRVLVHPFCSKKINQFCIFILLMSLNWWFFLWIFHDKICVLTCLIHCVFCYFWKKKYNTNSPPLSWYYGIIQHLCSHPIWLNESSTLLRIFFIR